MRVDFPEGLRVTRECPVTIIQHVEGAVHRTSTHPYSTPPSTPDDQAEAERDHASPVLPASAQSFLSKLWSKTKYGQGYVKVHQGTTTRWVRVSR